MMQYGGEGMGNSHIAILRNDLYPRHHGRNLSGGTVIRTSRIAMEPDFRLPQFRVRCQVCTLDLPDVLASGPKEYVYPLYLSPLEPRAGEG